MNKYKVYVHIFPNNKKEAARVLGLNRSHITSCCTGKRKSTGGYSFRYWKGGDAYVL
ncbi:MAG: hypothetical protein VZQ62_00555 [Methanosphaera sp.]|nr:hypothetical protein [Methanosphaera sp.]